MGLGAAATGSGVVFGSGAFSSVSVDRTVTVDVVDDSAGDAGIQLQPLTNNASFARINNGKFEFNFDNDDGSADVNQDSTVRFGAEFTITNNGDQPVRILVDVSGLTSKSSVDSLSFFTAINAIADSEFSVNSSLNSVAGGASSTFAIDGAPNDPPQNEGVVLASGGADFPVAGAIGLADSTADFSDASITIHAVSDNDEAFPQAGPTDTARFNNVGNTSSVPIFGVTDPDTDTIAVNSDGSETTSPVTAVYDGGITPILESGL